MSCLFSCFREPKAPELPAEPEFDISTIQNAKRYTYEELQIATQNFHGTNKIGRGGFGSVFKGKLEDGTPIAVKLLAQDSKQGLREFLTEIKMIANVEHANLVKLHGYCAEEKHRLLVYGYLENNSVAKSLLSQSQSQIRDRFIWAVRRKICIGVARGLLYLHEEAEPRIVHRDIKASNILLDHQLTPKISDFGLAKIFPDNMTHISTCVAGTCGYLAPEYAQYAHLTKKSDIYSFGVLLLEIVCGRSHTMKRASNEEQFLLEWVFDSYESGELGKMVDTSMGPTEYEAEEACKYMKVALMCTQERPHRRPEMSMVFKMLTGEIDANTQKVSKPGMTTKLMAFRYHKNANKPVKNPSPDTSSTYSSTSSPPSPSFATMTYNSVYDRQ